MDYFCFLKEFLISICCLPHQTGKCGTRPFLGPEPTRARHFLKIPTAPSAFPLLGAPQAPGNKPNPPEGGKSLGDGPLRPKKTTSRQATPGQICDLSTGVTTRNLTELILKEFLLTHFNLPIF